MLHKTALFENVRYRLFPSFTIVNDLKCAFKNAFEMGWKFGDLKFLNKLLLQLICGLLVVTIPLELHIELLRYANLM